MSESNPTAPADPVKSAKPSSDFPFSPMPPDPAWRAGGRPALGRPVRYRSPGTRTASSITSRLTFE